MLTVSQKFGQSLTAFVHQFDRFNSWLLQRQHLTLGNKQVVYSRKQLVCWNIMSVFFTRSLWGVQTYPTGLLVSRFALLLHT